jgi:hypothetical protein
MPQEAARPIEAMEHSAERMEGKKKNTQEGLTTAAT